MISSMRGSLAVLVLLLIFTPSISYANVLISEIFYDPAESPEHNYEFVELYNSDSTIDISGWILQDDSKEYVIPDGTLLDSGAYFIVDRALVSNSFSLKNTGETLVFKNGSEIQDTKIYEDDADQGLSLQRQQDGTWQPGTPTPGSGALSFNEQESTSSSPVQAQVNIITTEVTKYNTVIIEPPQDIHIREQDDKIIIVGSLLSIEPELYDAIGKVADAQCHITFGDGAESKSCKAQHIYEYAGEYVVSIAARQGALHDRVTIRVKVLEPEFAIQVSADKEYIELSNKLKQQVELNDWRVKVDYKTFLIPDNTIIPASSTIKISAKTMGIDIARHGGVARLVNAFNKTIADSKAMPMTLELIEEEPPSEPVPAIIVPSIASTASAGSSIIGMPAPKQRAGAQQKAQVIDKELAPVIARVESVAAAATPTMWQRVIPQDSQRWAVGLLALIGLASVPIFFSNTKKPAK